MIVAMTGGRDLVVTPVLARAFFECLFTTHASVLRHGNARGADRWAASAAAAAGVVVEAWPFELGGRDRRAGLIRNYRAMR